MPIGGGEKRMSVRYLVLSTIIVTCLALQGWAFFAGGPLYPFIDYPMYCVPHNPPVQTHTRTLKVELADGRTVVADPAFLDLGYFYWRHRLVDPLIRPLDDDAKTDRARRRRREARRYLKRAIRRRTQSEAQALVVESTHYRIKQGELKRTRDTKRIAFDPSHETRHARGDR
jgi:hypothetical protein